MEATKKDGRSATRNNVNPNGSDGDPTKGVRPLTSVELLDAAVWREIGTEDPQPAPAFLEALAALLGRWLLVRSRTPEMDTLTVLCRVRGYVARHGCPNGDGDLQHDGKSQ
jgi:hypothetical protein